MPCEQHWIDFWSIWIGFVLRKPSKGGQGSAPSYTRNEKCDTFERACWEALYELFGNVCCSSLRLPEAIWGSLWEALWISLNELPSLPFPIFFYSMLEVGDCLKILIFRSYPLVHGLVQWKRANTAIQGNRWWFFFCTDGGMSQYFEKTWKMLFFLDSLAHVPLKNEILRFAPPHLQKVQPTYFSSWEENWSFFCRGVEQTTFLSFAPWPLSRPQVNVNLQRYLTRREFLGFHPLIIRRFSPHTFHLEKKTEVFSAEGSSKQHFFRLHPHPWVHLKWMWTCKGTSQEENS